MPAMNIDNRSGTLIITIDGPAGTGKSSAAVGLARRLGIAHLDTGAMYRAVTWQALHEGLDLADGEALAALAGRCRIALSDGSVTIDGTDVTSAIRGDAVTAAVHHAASAAAVREVLVAQQRRIAGELRKLVTEGRDQGSVVFPDATVKFYLDAAAECRARRRYDQLIAGGQSADYDRILADQQVRDARDRNRNAGPLTVPDGAVVIDTTSLTLAQVIDAMETTIKETLQ